ncbi:hypothetical protein OB236_14380 [Paenibacillus sp. WQ 127069]|uniref:Uncharacterized protein n=1 Tax=Paenibacillus baimaensis TaxID=2982185 RepID=A0ABT2UFA9_9BACL|nr:hypothetical protein [Paenibacillus sp. WQ 127069]MCU6793300.1 hypothetical protein [Paenibacillus sp. WQ 127069]
MGWRKFQKWSSFTFFMVYGLVITSIICFLGYIIWYALSDKEAISSSIFINQIALIMAFVSLSGILMSLLSALDMHKKKKFKATTLCPHCRHNVVINLVEE